MLRLVRNYGLLSVPALAMALASCASNAPVKLEESGATLEGTITHNGKPVQFALVIVQAANGQGATATGKPDLEGNYKVLNVPIGEVKIAVNTDAGEGDFRTASMQQGAYAGPDKNKAKRVQVDFNKVPKKFHAPDTTTITTTISKGSNKFDIVVPK